MQMRNWTLWNHGNPPSIFLKKVRQVSLLPYQSKPNAPWIGRLVQGRQDLHHMFNYLERWDLTPLPTCPGLLLAPSHDNICL